MYLNLIGTNDGDHDCENPNTAEFFCTSLTIYHFIGSSASTCLRTQTANRPITWWPIDASRTCRSGKDDALKLTVVVRIGKKEVSMRTTSVWGFSLTADWVGHWHYCLQGWQRLDPNRGQRSESASSSLLKAVYVYIHMYPLLPRSKNSKATDLIEFFWWPSQRRGAQKGLTTEPGMTSGLASPPRCGLKIFCHWLRAFHFAQISHSFMHRHHNPLTLPLSLGQEWFYSYINTSVGGAGVTRLEMSQHLTHN